MVLHHGTILVDTNFEKMKDILTPDISKLESKGVKSVKSRVLNLKEIKNITIKEVQKAIEKEFIKWYGEKIKAFKIGKYKSEVLKQKNFYKSRKWLKNEEFKFAPIVFQKKSKDGLITIKRNKCGEYKIFSDSIDTEKIKKIQHTLNEHSKECPSKVVKKILSFID